MAPARSICHFLTPLAPWLPVALLVLAFALRAAGLDAESLWRDEVDAIRFATAPLPDLLAMFRQPGQNGPLYYLILRPWLGLTGTSEFALRYLSTLCGVLGVALTYHLARRLFPAGRWVPALAALLAATSAYLAWYAQEGKMYSLVVLLSLAATACYVAALQRGGWARWLAYALLTSAAIYVHLVAAALVPAHAVAFLFAPVHVRRRRWRGWLGAMAALTLPYVPLLAWQVPMLRAPGATGYSPVSPVDMVASLLSSYSLGVLPPTSPWWILPFAAALVAPFVWRSGRGNPRFSLGLLAAWLVVPVVLFGIVSLVRPMYTARYLIFVLPALILLLAAGLAALARRTPLLAALLLAAILALNARGLWVQARTPLKADFRAATSYLLDHLRPGDLVIFQIPYGRHSFDYYAGRERVAAARRASPPADSHAPWQRVLPLAVRRVPLAWAEGLYTNQGITPEEAGRLLAEQVAGRQVVWFVASEVVLWDERGLVESWLAQHATLTGRRDFVRVSVQRYAFP